MPVYNTRLNYYPTRGSCSKRINSVTTLSVFILTCVQLSFLFLLLLLFCERILVLVLAVSAAAVVVFGIW